jgi:hypothetical protein
MAKWEEHIVVPPPNPEVAAAIQKIRRARALRRARECYDMPLSQKRAELYAAGFTQQEIAEILGTVEPHQ